MLKKVYSKTGRSCRVTFNLPAEVNAETVSVCGDFNNWDPTSHPMKRKNGGSFSLTISLKPDRVYRFRYVLDQHRWENDWAADGYVPNTFGSEDSLVSL